MSLKQEIETWVTALAHYDKNEFDESLHAFDNISDTSKILFNIGVIHATLGEHEKAVEAYLRAVKLDKYLAVAYFQQGVSNFLMGDFEEALANFNDALHYLRGNNNIDYEQLGLKFKLFACEVLFNRGLCYIYLRQTEQGMQDLTFASKEKVVPDHEVIDEAIRERAEGYTVFSIPVGIVYRPNEAKVKNLKAKDYLGKARLVAATDRNQAFTGFSGAEIKKMNAPVDRDDRPQEAISYAATNLVKPDVKSRNRQTSEPPPPNGRLQYPPTPPPESDKPDPEKTKALSRAESVRAGPKPKPLDLSIAGFDRRASNNSTTSAANPATTAGSQQAALRPRRAESERPAMRSQSVRQPNASSSPSSMQRRNTERRRQPEPAADAGYDDLYSMYGRSQGLTTTLAAPSRSSRNDTGTSNGRQQQMYIEEENEYEDDEYSASYDEADFEMLSAGNSSTGVLPTRMGTRRIAPAPAMTKIRVKVHAEDTRYVMVTPRSSATSHSSSSTYHSTASLGSNSSADSTSVAFSDFVDAIRTKFGIRTNFKIKIKDDQDMITMADQDDLDMAVESARSAAKKERSEMGKMEVWIQAN